MDSNSSFRWIFGCGKSAHRIGQVNWPDRLADDGRGGRDGGLLEYYGCRGAVGDVAKRLNCGGGGFR